MSILSAVNLILAWPAQPSFQSPFALKSARKRAQKKAAFPQQTLLPGKTALHHHEAGGVLPYLTISNSSTMTLLGPLTITLRILP